MILGGDGFCGWPTTLHLSARGHDVDVVDNFARRRADVELGAESLTPIRTLDERREAWREVTGRDIEWNMVPYDVQLIGHVTRHLLVNFADRPWQ